jgi:hypothetical protein
MNNLPIYNSTSDLTSKFEDIFIVIIIPTLCLIGVFILKMITFRVLHEIIFKLKNNDIVYRYMLAFEISDTILGIIVGLMGVFACGSYCNFSYKFITKTFQLVFLTFGSNVIILFQTFLDISFAWQRVKSFSSKKNVEKNFKRHLVYMLIAAIILIAPSYIITRSVEPIGILRRTDQNQSDEILYSIATAKFAQNDYWTYALLALNLFNGFILYNILLCINILVIFRFKAYLNKRKQINEPAVRTDELAVKKNKQIKKPKIKGVKTTKTVLAMSINFLVGNLPISISPIVFQFSGYSTFYNYYTTFTVLLGLLTHPGYIFLYFMLNPLFRKTLQNIYFK